MSIVDNNNNNQIICVVNSLGSASSITTRVIFIDERAIQWNNVYELKRMFLLWLHWEHSMVLVARECITIGKRIDGCSRFIQQMNYIIFFPAFVGQHTQTHTYRPTKLQIVLLHSICLFASNCNLNWSTNSDAVLMIFENTYSKAREKMVLTEFSGVTVVFCCIRTANLLCIVCTSFMRLCNFISHL